jgi:hypothetical protein
MVNPVTLPLIFSALWALLLLGAYLWLAHALRFKATSALQAILIIIAAAALVRIVPEIALPVGAGYDIESYQTVGSLVLDHQDVYTSDAAIGRYPYLPLQMYWMGVSKWLAVATHLPFVKIVKLAAIAADIAISVLLFKLLYRSSGLLQPAFLGGLLYAFNPVSVFVSAYHGQFDAIPLLCILLALWFLPRSSLAAAGWLGLGILDKSWPVLVLPSIFYAIKSWPRRFWFLAVVVLTPILGVAAYSFLLKAPWVAIIRTALSYNNGVGIWGYSYFFRLLSVLRPGLDAPFIWLVNNGKYVTLGVLGLVWVLRASKQSLEGGILTILVTFFAFTHAFSIQYLVWIVPFAILSQDRVWLTRYTLAAFAYMFLVYFTLVLEMHITTLMPMPQADYFIIMPAGLPAWFVALGWIYKRVQIRG